MIVRSDDGSTPPLDLTSLAGLPDAHLVQIGWPVPTSTTPDFRRGLAVAIVAATVVWVIILAVLRALA